MTDKITAVGNPEQKEPGFFAKLWQIRGKETKKAYPLMLMMFLICFSYTLLRDLKDVMVLEIGRSELISYLKLLGTLPVSIIFMIVYTKISINSSKQFVFYSILSFFLGVYAFIMVMWAFKSSVQPKKGSLEDSFPEALKPLGILMENWIVVLVFIFGEMYGTVILSLLFWGFANDICTVDEAGRFYSLFSLIANVALLILSAILLSLDKALAEHKDIFLQISMATTIIFGFIIAYTYRWMQLNVLTDPDLYNPEKVKPKKNKPKMGFVESIKFVFSSGYIAKIAVLVVAYGAVINFMEIYYKNALNLFWLKQTILGKGLETGLTGFMVIVLSLFIGGTAVAKFGWTKTALATPVLIALFGIPFLAIQLGYCGPLINMVGQLGKLKKAKQSLDAVKDIAEYSLVLPIYVFGLITVVCAKSFKYSFFDPTKGLFTLTCAEMAYIPLDPEIRGKAKAAVDVVGARFGKSGASAIFLFLNPFFSNNSLNYVHTILGIFVLSVLAWIYCTISLGKAFNAKNEENREREKQEKLEAGKK